MCVCYSSRRRGDETVCVWLIYRLKLLGPIPRSSVRYAPHLRHTCAAYTQTAACAVLSGTPQPLQ